MPRYPMLGFVVILLVLPSGLHAQAPTLTPGSRVRVWPACPASTPARACSPVIGQFLGFQGDSLLIQEDGGPPRVIPGDPAMRLEVSAGRRGHTLLGLGVGTLTGLATGAALVSSCTTGSEDDGLCNIYYLITVPAGAGLGSILGALIRTDRWQSVAASRISLNILPMPHRVSVTLGVRF